MVNYFNKSASSAVHKDSSIQNLEKISKSITDITKNVKNKKNID